MAMKWGKLLLYFSLIGLIIGAVVGLCYLFLYLFVSIFISFTDMMVIKGADPSWAAIVGLILTVYIFFSISKNTTINNYIKGKIHKEEEE